MTETHEQRIKRLRIRSWRRGTKEMDLILGGFADDLLESLTPHQLDAHERLMEEQDQDLYLWISGQDEPPSELRNSLKLVKNYFLNPKK